VWTFAQGEVWVACEINCTGARTFQLVPSPPDGEYVDWEHGSQLEMELSEGGGVPGDRAGSRERE